MAQSRSRLAGEVAPDVVEARQAIQAGAHDRAQRVLQDVLGEEPANSQARYLLGVAHYQAGRYDDAATAFRRLVDDHPEDHRALYSLANALEKQGDLAGACEALSRSLAANPGFSEARQRLASISARLAAPEPDADFGGASATLAAGLEQDPGAPPDGRLLASGRRRVSSMAGRFLIAGMLAVLGAALSLLSSTGLSAFLAQLTMLGRTPDFYRARLEETPAFEFPADGFGLSPAAGVEADLARSVAELADRAALFDLLISRGGVLLAAVAAAVAVWAVLSATFTRYEIFTHRIDITRGILARQSDTVWLYEINDVVFQQPLWLLLTGNARITLRTDAGPHRIVGFGNASAMRRLWAEIRDTAVSERRAMRRWWI